MKHRILLAPLFLATACAGELEIGGVDADDPANDDGGTKPDGSNGDGGNGGNGGNDDTDGSTHTGAIDTAIPGSGNPGVDPDPGPDDDPDPSDAVTPSDCGPFRRPPAAVTGPSRTFTGTTTLEEDPRAIWQSTLYTWTGCEVERHFDADGFLVCEVVWKATNSGNGNRVPGWQEKYRYEVELQVDAGATSCADAKGKTLWYEAAISGKDVELGRRVTSPGWSINPSYDSVGKFPSTTQGRKRTFDYQGKFDTAP